MLSLRRGFILLLLGAVLLLVRWEYVVLIETATFGAKPSLNVGDQENENESSMGESRPSPMYKPADMSLGRDMGVREENSMADSRMEKDNALSATDSYILKQLETELGYDYFHSKPLLSIRGLMSSGTNWLRALIGQNCPSLPFQEPRMKSIDADGYFGWKHGFLEDFETKRLQMHPNHHIIVLTRDPFDWMAASAHHRGARSLPLYLRCRMKLSCTQLRSTKLTDIYYSRCKHGKNYLSFSNELSWRRRTLNSWYEAYKVVPNQIHFLRYEDLKSNELSAQALIELLPPALVSANCKSSLVNINKHVKYGTIRSGKPTNRLPAFCSSITEDSFNQALTYLDVPLEARLRYNIDTNFTSFKAKGCKSA